MLTSFYLSPIMNDRLLLLDNPRNIYVFWDIENRKDDCLQLTIDISELKKLMNGYDIQKKLKIYDVFSAPLQLFQSFSEMVASYLQNVQLILQRIVSLHRCVPLRDKTKPDDIFSKLLLVPHIFPSHKNSTRQRIHILIITLARIMKANKYKHFSFHRKSTNDYR